MQLDIVVAFVVLGALASAVKSDLELPRSLYRSLTIFLLIAIGLKGGIALADHGSMALIWQSLAVIVMGLVLPLIAFPLLARFERFGREDAASIAAHYGSVSVGTYAVPALPISPCRRVMRSALPNANHSVAIAASLGVTFPFNVLVGIPLYLVIIEWIAPFL